MFSFSFPGYIEEEKLNIARGFLVPKQRQEHGLKEEQLLLEEGALRRLIREYTRESGVRNLEREIATICRKVAKEVASGHEEPTEVGEERVKEFLGPRRHHFGVAEEKDEVGAATGLVYTEVGGDIVAIEATLLRAREGRLTLTGQLGDVMKESAMAALSYVRSRAQWLGFEAEFYDHTEIHIHVPAAAQPKDGPSAGITMATALASALTQRPIRKDVAMTGEITLRGKVMAVGGVKEKVLAAHRAGLRTVILPAENERDLEEIPGHVREEMTFHFAVHCDEVLKLALLERVEAPAVVA